MELSKKLFRKRSHKWSTVYLPILFLFLSCSVSAVSAGPEGAQVVNGQVTIQQSGNNTAITASDKAIINYSSFDITQPETVRFIQPSSSASVLNRILSANPTNIDGNLLANGRVFFVNPAGIYIGNGARINVNQLVASGLNISNADFINGRYNFAGGNGAVINEGDISAQKVYLIGKQVTNSGNINCPAGYVAMAAGDKVFLSEPGSDIVLDIEGTSLSAPAASESGVLNTGTVEAAGGIIALAAAGDLYSQAISNIGSLSSSVESGDAGKVKLTAAEGTVINSGSLEAKSSSGTGGTIQMLGDKVGLLDAGRIDVSGSDGGGTVLVGGDYQGKGDVLTASQTYVGPDSSIMADATENGDGGKVIVWSDEITRFYGDISARGGPQAGNGGFIEVSGKENLGFYGDVDTLAPNGKMGTLLLDPTDIVISNADGTDGASAGDILFADSPAAEPWNVTPAQLDAVAGNIILQADVDITVTDSVSLTTNGVGIIAQAGDDVIVNASITTQGGSLDFTANDNSNGTASGSGSVILNAALDTTANSQNGGAVTLMVDGGTGDIQLGNNITTNTANITIEGPVTLISDSSLSTTAGVGGDIIFNSAVNGIAAGNESFSLTAGTGAVTLGSAGTGTALEALSVTTSGLTTLNGAIYTDDNVGTGNVDLSGATGGITLGADVAIDTDAGGDGTGGAVNLSGSSVVSTTDAIEGLIIDAADGAVTLAGIGSTSALEYLSVTGGSALLGGNITTDNSTGTGNVTIAMINDININNSITAGGAISLQATNGAVTQNAGIITTNSGSLSMTSNDALNMSNYTVADPGSTNVVLDSTGGSTVITGLTADDWKSITASAQHDVVLSGNGDVTTGDLVSIDASYSVQISTVSGGSLDVKGTIDSGGFVKVNVEGNAGFDQAVSADGNIGVEAGGDIIANAMNSTGGNIEMKSSQGNLAINGGLTADAGGVSLISETGNIYTPGGSNDTINVSITASSNNAAGTGVNLPFGSRKAAIVITSAEDLILGPGAILTANGLYKPAAYDDRGSVDFDTSQTGGGDRIDVAIYLGSIRLVGLDELTGTVAVNSKVQMAKNGGMVVDAGEIVMFGGKFNESIFNQTHRLEVISRKSSSLNEVRRFNRLPFADNPEAIRSWFNETSTGYFAGAYVLRGVRTLLAEVLSLSNPVPLVPPRTLESEFRGEVVGPDIEALATLLSELGIGDQPYMTEAYADSLSTDLRLYKAAEKLHELIPVLEDVNDTRIVALNAAVEQFLPTLDLLSEERMNSFTQLLESHKGDGTDYDLAGQCMFALREYVNILSTEIGWSVERSIEFVMGRYFLRVTENDETKITIIKTYLQKQF